MTTTWRELRKVANSIPDTQLDDLVTLVEKNTQMFYRIESVEVSDQFQYIKDDEGDREPWTLSQVQYYAWSNGVYAEDQKAFEEFKNRVFEEVTDEDTVILNIS